MIAIGVRWYLLRPVFLRREELLAECDIEVDHVTIYGRVQTFPAELIDAARPTRHASGDRWSVDET